MTTHAAASPAFHALQLVALVLGAIAFLIPLTVFLPVLRAPRQRSENGTKISDSD